VLGVFGSLDRIENNNRYEYVISNPINLADPSGNQSSNSWMRYLEIAAIYWLVQAGLNPIQQQPCSQPPYSPFGCDTEGRPVEYVIVQGFGQAPYPVLNNCSDWSSIDGYR
jgi:hypothetical protein